MIFIGVNYYDFNKSNVSSSEMCEYRVSSTNASKDQKEMYEKIYLRHKLSDVVVGLRQAE